MEDENRPTDSRDASPTQSHHSHNSSISSATNRTSIAPASPTPSTPHATVQTFQFDSVPQAQLATVPAMHGHPTITSGSSGSPTGSRRPLKGGAAIKAAQIIALEDVSSPPTRPWSTEDTHPTERRTDLETTDSSFSVPPQPTSTTAATSSNTTSKSKDPSSPLMITNRSNEVSSNVFTLPPPPLKTPSNAIRQRFFSPAVGLKSGLIARDPSIPKTMSLEEKELSISTPFIHISSLAPNSELLAVNDVPIRPTQSTADPLLAASAPKSSHSTTRTASVTQVKQQQDGSVLPRTLSPTTAFALATSTSNTIPHNLTSTTAIKSRIHKGPSKRSRESSPTARLPVQSDPATVSLTEFMFVSPPPQATSRGVINAAHTTGKLLNDLIQPTTNIIVDAGQVPRLTHTQQPIQLSSYPSKPDPNLVQSLLAPTSSPAIVKKVKPNESRQHDASVAPSSAHLNISIQQFGLGVVPGSTSRYSLQPTDDDAKYVSFLTPTQSHPPSKLNTTNSVAIDSSREETTTESNPGVLTSEQANHLNTHWHSRSGLIRMADGQLHETPSTLNAVAATNPATEEKQPALKNVSKKILVAVPSQAQSKFGSTSSLFSDDTSKASHVTIEPWNLKSYQAMERTVHPNESQSPAIKKESTILTQATVSNGPVAVSQLIRDYIPHTLPSTHHMQTAPLNSSALRTRLSTPPSSTVTDHTHGIDPLPPQPTRPLGRINPNNPNVNHNSSITRYGSQRYIPYVLEPHTNNFTKRTPSESHLDPSTKVQQDLHHEKSWAELKEDINQALPAPPTPTAATEQIKSKPKRPSSNPNQKRQPLTDEERARNQRRIQEWNEQLGLDQDDEDVVNKNAQIQRDIQTQQQRSSTFKSQVRHQREEVINDLLLDPRFDITIDRSSPNDAGPMWTYFSREEKLDYLLRKHGLNLPGVLRKRMQPEEVDPEVVFGCEQFSGFDSLESFLKARSTEQTSPKHPSDPIPSMPPSDRSPTFMTHSDSTTFESTIPIRDSELIMIPHSTKPQPGDFSRVRSTRGTASALIQTDLIRQSLISRAQLALQRVNANMSEMEAKQRETTLQRVEREAAELKAYGLISSTPGTALSSPRHSYPSGSQTARDLQSLELPRSLPYIPFTPTLASSRIVTSAVVQKRLQAAGATDRWARDPRPRMTIDDRQRSKQDSSGHAALLAMQQRLHAKSLSGSNPTTSGVRPTTGHGEQRAIHQRDLDQVLHAMKNNFHASQESTAITNSQQSSTTTQRAGSPSKSQRTRPQVFSWHQNNSRPVTRGHVNPSPPPSSIPTDLKDAYLSELARHRNEFELAAFDIEYLASIEKRHIQQLNERLEMDMQIKLTEEEELNHKINLQKKDEQRIEALAKRRESIMAT